MCASHVRLAVAGGDKRPECHLVLAEVCRQLALVEPKSSPDRSKAMASAEEYAKAAHTAYSGLVGKRAKRGMAHCLRTLGRLKEDNKVGGLRRCWRCAWVIVGVYGLVYSGVPACESPVCVVCPHDTSS